MVELVATVAPSYRQVRPVGSARIGASPTVQATPRPRHVPSSHRYCVPSWQLAAPVQYEMPFRAQLRDVFGESSGVQGEPVAFQSPFLQRNCAPVWHDIAPSENMLPLKKQWSLAARTAPGYSAAPSTTVPTGKIRLRGIQR